MLRLLTNVMALSSINDLLEDAVCNKMDLAHQKARKYMEERQLEGVAGDEIEVKKIGFHQYALPVKDWDELGLMTRQDIINFDLDVASDAHRHTLGKGRRMAQWAKENRRLA